MSSIRTNGADKCPECGHHVLLDEECILCDSKAPQLHCRGCQGTGRMKTCAHCGADYWRAKQQKEARAAK